MSESWQRRLSIVIPAFDEEDGIVEVLSTLTSHLPASEIIVVDDASMDGTAARVEAFAGVQLIRHPFNKGYGASLKTGMRVAQCDYIAWFDADNEHRVEDLVKMVKILRRRKLSAIIGQRQNSTPSAVRSIGKFLIRIVARSLNSTSAKDLNCGLRVFQRTAILPYLNVLPDKFSASITSTMILMDRGYPLDFFPVTLNSRLGKSKVVLSDGLTALFLVFRIVMLVAPLQVFLRSGLLIMALGMAYGIYLKTAISGPFAISSLVLIIFGMFLCVLGLISDQISQVRLNAVVSKENPPNDHESR